MTPPLADATVSLRPSFNVFEFLRRFRNGRGVHAETQKMAVAAFAIRVISAACLYLSQALLARWLGGSEFGTYIYAWTWVMLIGDTVHLGLGHVAQRFIPRYEDAGATGHVLGFLRGSELMVLGSSTLAAVIAGCAAGFSGRPDSFTLELAALAIPAFAFSVLFDGISRCYNWVGLALLPAYVVRPLLITGLVAGLYAAGGQTEAAPAMMATVAACWIAVFIQACLTHFRIGRRIAPGPRNYQIGTWVGASLPTLLMWGFYMLLTSTDVIVLQYFRSSDDVAHYYAAAKTLAIVAFVNFAVSAAAGHRFSQFHSAGDGTKLRALVRQCVKWTFWGSLAATLAILALGWPFLWLFGPEFVSAYPLMFVLALGLLARASIGPAERVLSMCGHQNSCALIYAAAFGLNLALCFLLAGPYGGMGVASAISAAMLLESVLLYLASRRLLGISPFVFQRSLSTRSSIDGKPIVSPSS